MSDFDIPAGFDDDYRDDDDSDNEAPNQSPQLEAKHLLAF